MGMVVRTNTMAINAYRQLGLNNNAVSKSLEKLASGYRINRAGDDAAGLAISEKMKAQITGLETASANAQDGISLIQTAEGNLSEVHDMLNRMVELATKSANGTYTSTERDALQAEVKQLLDEIDRISKSANFNGAKLLDGTMGMNNEAFTIGTTKDATPSGTNIITGTAVDVPTDHISAGKSQVAPEFSVKFTDFEATAAAVETPAENLKADLELSFGGQAVTFLGKTAADIDSSSAATSLELDSGAKADYKIDGAALGTALDGQYILIKEDVYKASNTAGTVKFEWAGTFDGETFTAKADGAEVAEESWIPEGDVSITLTGSDQVDGDIEPDGVHADCMVTKVKDPVAGADNLRAGATLDVSTIVDALKAGSKLKIGETTFELDSKAAQGITGDKTAGWKIGTKDVADDDLTQFITEQMSNATAVVKKGTVSVDFNINRDTADGKIHIDEDEKSGTTAGKYEGFTKAELEKVFATVDSQSNASITFTVKDNNKMADTESISIDGEKYEFAKGADAETTLNNLKSKLGTAYEAEVNGDTITIKAANFEDAAPVITGSGLTLQIGDTSEEFNKMNVAVPNMSSAGLKLAGLTVANQTSAADAIDKIKTAINTVSTVRANMGALQNRLEHTINNLDVAAENLSSANSRIRDTDMAKEMMNYTKMNVLVQSAQAMLAQANQQPQSVLQLLQ